MEGTPGNPNPFVTPWGLRIHSKTRRNIWCLTNNDNSVILKVEGMPLGNDSDPVQVL
jgi:hypothetical protein